MTTPKDIDLTDIKNKIQQLPPKYLKSLLNDIDKLILKERNPFALVNDEEKDMLSRLFTLQNN